MPHQNVIVVGQEEKYEYGDTDEELYKTNGYGGSDVDLDATERYTGDIDLTSLRQAIVDFKHDSSGTTDDILLYLYKRRDSTWDGDEMAVWSTTVVSDGSEDIYHFTITESYGAGHFRFGMKRSGTTDTFEIDVQMRRSNLIRTI